MKGGEVGEEGWEGQGEKDSSVSLTWQVYYTSQWGETWRWRLGAKEDKGSRSMWQDGWYTVVFFCLCWGSQRFLQSKALETSWLSNSVTLTFINRYPSVKTDQVSQQAFSYETHWRWPLCMRMVCRAKPWDWDQTIAGRRRDCGSLHPTFQVQMLLQRHLNRPHGHQGKKEDDSESPN